MLPPVPISRDIQEVRSPITLLVGLSNWASTEFAFDFLCHWHGKERTQGH